MGIKAFVSSNAGRIQHAQIMFLQIAPKVPLTPLQDYFSVQFSAINIDSLTGEHVRMLLRFVSLKPAQHTSSHRHEYIFTQTFGLLVMSVSGTV